jgi:hypothetical protein
MPRAESPHGQSHGIAEIAVEREKTDEPTTLPKIGQSDQSLQWVFGQREAGIRGPDDAQRIKQGADALEKYCVDCSKQQGFEYDCDAPQPPSRSEQFHAWHVHS